MIRVRFVPGPTGSLHFGNALSAVANWRFADERGGLLRLRIDAAAGLEPRARVRGLRTAGGDLRAVRLALTGHDRRPELWAIPAAPPRDALLRRIDAQLR